MSNVLINGYKGSIYPEGNGYTGVLDLGWTANGKRNRPKRKGRSKAIVTIHVGVSPKGANIAGRPGR